MAPRSKKKSAKLAMGDRRSYDDVAQRVLAAVEEFNAAFREAHEHPEVRVEGAWSPPEETPPLQFHCKIFRLTHASPIFLSWRVVKHRDGEGEEKSWIAKLDEATAKAT